MRTKSENPIEYTRQICLKLLAQKMKQAKIAEIIGKTQGYVSQIKKRYEMYGEQGLKEKKAAGAACKISESQKASLEKMIDLGAENNGFEGAIWTRKRIKMLIEGHFSVIYSEKQIGRLLKKMGYSLQKPQKKDYRQKESAIEKWKKEDLPAYKKKHKKKIG